MATHYQGSDEERRALDVYIKLTRAAESVSDRTTRHLVAAGLSVSQFGVLDALYHLGPLCLSDLARKHLRSRNNFTTVIDNMEKNNLVVRERVAEDRRMVRVHLTDKGREVFVKEFAPHVRALVDNMRALSPAEQETLGALCRRLGKQENPPA